MLVITRRIPVWSSRIPLRFSAGISKISETTTTSQYIDVSPVMLVVSYDQKGISVPVFEVDDAVSCCQLTFELKVL